MTSENQRFIDNSLLLGTVGNFLCFVSVFIEQNNTKKDLFLLNSQS